MMKKTRFALLFTSLFFAHLILAQQNKSNDEYAIQQFELKLNTGIRAIAAVDDRTCWFAGSNGIFGYTEDGGKTWKTDSILMDSIKPEFRAISVLNKQTVLLLNAGSPAYLLKTTDKGETWRTVYTDTNPKIFFDAMKFRDQRNGIAVGDPIDSCFIIIKTNDGGETWQQADCKKVPKAFAGEACFASSNSNVCFIGINIMIATGGSHSRILRSEDAGQSWNVYTTPITCGKQMTGIYTIDFFNTQKGIIAGGNYDEKENSSDNKAVTTDGGKTWKVVSDKYAPGFISCIKYAPDGKGKTILASCLPGLFLSSDAGSTWRIINQQSSFYTFHFSPSGKTVWLAGAKGRLGKLAINLF